MKTENESDPGFTPTEPGKWIMWSKGQGWRECDVIEHDRQLCVLVNGDHEPTSAHRWNGRAHITIAIVMPALIEAVVIKGTITV